MGASLCLVDGTYELFRAYYGAPSQPSETGRELGATFQLGRSLATLARSGEFTHYAVAFDTVIESFRNELFPGYKTGEGIEPLLWEQFEPAERLTEALGFPALSMIEFEADDALATLAARFAEDPAVDRVVIASPDKDLMQCVRGQRVVTWDRKREIFYDEAGVLTKMGVSPASIPDYLALVGDTADGIPGVARWGAQSAAKILRRYGHIEHIPDAESEWEEKVRGAAALAQELRTHREDALLYRTLATLRVDVPLPERLEAWTRRPVAVERVEELARLWGAPRFLRFLEA